MEVNLNEYASDNKNFTNYQDVSYEAIRLVNDMIDKIKNYL
jgi:hypothetical protein